ncbi:recombinase RecA [Mesoplasma entomophilum]|uniref:recombinase RecA n=1 Tax=Mesoplasma entomophilum TaxID=2149 RepID=UPI000D03E2A7|nr:recombinase RecA [Mesoplasma entomophilum]AVN60224.1 recombinase RecA [Mesoplasma entomophilum]
MNNTRILEGASKAMSNKNDIWKNEALVAALKTIEKNYGKEALVVYNEGDDIDHDVISSGSFLIDQAIGIGGYPKGRVVEIFGPESSGKTTLALHAIAEAQKQQGVAAFIDAEHSLDLNYAKKIGVDINNLLVSQPSYGEEALDILETLVKSNSVNLVVVDSVAALVPKSELEGEMSDQSIGLQARMMSKALRKLNGAISKSKTTVIFINQLREKIGIMFGNPETTTGGRALKFFSTLRVEVRKGESLIENGVVVANKVKVKIVKNKVAAPFKQTLITIGYDKGIERTNEIIELATLYNILDKSGVWYSYEKEKIGQGKNAVKEWLSKNPEKAIKIETELKEYIEKA